MNNSLERLLDGMVSTLDELIIPHISDDFARGQAFGVIYMLRCIGKRASWATGYLRAQVDALQVVTDELRSLLSDLPDLPGVLRAPTLPLGEVGADANEADLKQARDDLNQAACAAYEWCEAQRAVLPQGFVTNVRAAWERYLTVQLRSELKFNVSLNFSEISTGHAAAKAG